MSLSIVITGASGGIGQALAHEMSAPGRRLLLIGRSPDRLAVAANLARARGADVTLLQAAMAETEAMTHAIRDFAATGGLDWVILNAGVKTGNQIGVEAPGQSRRVLMTNLVETVELANAVLPILTAQGHGRIALMASLAGISPQGNLLSYSASKAGLRAYSIALRRALRGSGVGVSVMTPGFVATKMTARQLGPHPGLISANAAAARIHKGLLKGKSSIRFPLWLSALSHLVEALPAVLADPILARFGGDILPDDDESPVS